MHHSFRWVCKRFADRRCVGLWLLAALAAPGCDRDKAAPSVKEPPVMHVTTPKLETLTRVVNQPSFVESYERTSIYPKVTGYIQQWYVDIGDTVKKDQLLALLYVPELKEDWETKKAMVTLDEQRIQLALRVVDVTEADVKAAAARVKETEAILGQSKAQLVRWESEVKRLKKEVDNGVVDPQVHLESVNQRDASLAAVKAAEAAIEKAKAELESKKCTLAQNKVDVDVARATLGVAKSDARRLEAWVSYLKLTAPFDGKVVARNANTRDFVRPAAGDPSADPRAPYQGLNGTAAPIYVIDRIDVVRIFVDVPEKDANYVTVGTKATVQIKAFRDKPIEAIVSRTSWALNTISRTLRAEIDLVNTDKPGTYQDLGHHQVAVAVPTKNGAPQILPGMYAYGKVKIERTRVRALPVDAVSYSGESAYFWSYEDGHAVRIDVETGISDGKMIEVTNWQRPPSPDEEASGKEMPWKPFTGSEQVLLGDLSILTDGSPVKIGRTAEEMAKKKTP